MKGGKSSARSARPSGPEASTASWALPVLGKTTFFRILLGLDKPDSGTVAGTEGAFLSAVFQENRLCESFSSLDNVLMVFPKVTREIREAAKEDLCKLLPEESIYRPVSTLSGGMKRRVAVCRALAVPFDAVLMDEPFTGLDEDTRRKVIAFVKQKTNGKLANYQYPSGGGRSSSGRQSDTPYGRKKRDMTPQSGSYPFSFIQSGDAGLFNLK